PERLAPVGDRPRGGEPAARVRRRARPLLRARARGMEPRSGGDPAARDRGSHAPRWRHPTALAPPRTGAPLGSMSKGGGTVDAGSASGVLPFVPSVSVGL